MIGISLEQAGSLGLFRLAAMRDILLLLEKNSYSEYSIRDLHRALQRARSLYSVQRSAAALERAGLILSRVDGRKKLIRINPERLIEPGDPYWQVPQPEHRGILKTIIETVRTRIKGVLALILFGSFARGGADRVSDIDLLAVVNDAAASEKEAALIEHEAITGRLLGERYRLNIIVEEIADVRAADMKNPAIRSALTEGLVLFDVPKFRKSTRQVTK